MRAVLEHEARAPFRTEQVGPSPPRLPANPPTVYRTGMDLLDRITVEPDKRGGKPCIRGLRITVHDILDYLASGMTESEILADFPDLEPPDIRAALSFAAASER